MRYKEYTKYLIDVKGTLTLKDITIDGQGDSVESSSALIKVQPNGTLNIEGDTKLVNNKHTVMDTNYTESGGAIYCADGGHIYMSSGEISENSSWYGGAIELWGINALLILDGGSISNNEVTNVSNEISAGGGVAVMNGASFIFNSGNISKNKAMDSQGIGGGVMVGLVRMLDDKKSSMFEMNGGVISENDANINGGGIFVQCCSVAKINSGEIISNSCGKTLGISTAVGAYGGGGIYVNGGKGDYEDGKLYFPSGVFINNNTAKGVNGAGIAGCGTSTVYVYPLAATIYGNNGTEIYIDSRQTAGYGTTAKASISQLALGGGINHWSDNNGEKTSNELNNILPETVFELENANAENLDVSGSLSTIKITDNFSHTRGGGIGTNGYIQIGEPILTDIQVEKVWVDEDNKDGIRPDSIKINLLANDILIDSKAVTADDNWICCFANLPQYEDDKKIVYSITEDAVEGYETEVSGYKIINTHEVKKTDVSDVPDKPDTPDEPDVPDEPDIPMQLPIVTTPKKPILPVETTVTTQPEVTEKFEESEIIDEPIESETTVEKTETDVTTVISETESVNSDTTYVDDSDEKTNKDNETTVTNESDETAKNPKTSSSHIMLKFYVMVAALVIAILSFPRKHKNKYIPEHYYL